MAFRPNWYDENNPRGGALGRSIRDWSALRLILTITGVVYLIEMALLIGAGNSDAAVGVLYDVFALRSWNGHYLTDGTHEITGFNFLFPVQLVSYMFLHDYGGLSHIFWNMLFLWWFGRELEELLGKRGFLRLYFAGGILGGLLQWVANIIEPTAVPTVGASGAVYTVLVLFTLKWPRRTILLFPLFIPVPIMFVTAFKIAGDFLGFFGGASNVAHLVHLGGAGVGVVWWRYGDLLALWHMRSRREKAQKVVQEHSTDRREMDRILGKIQATGLASLDKRERAFLDRRSRELRDGRS